MTDALPLIGDGDEIALLREIETAFGVRLTRDEAGRCFTVGDLHAVLLSKVRHVERGAIPCLTAAAFRRLRRAIEERNPGQDIRPSTELKALGSTRRWWGRLQLDSGLRLPADRSDGLLLLLCIGAPLLVYPFFGSLSIFGFLVSVPLAFSLAAANPLPRCRTLGDVARAAAALNISSLSWPVGEMRTRDVWSALETIIRDELDWDGPVFPETRLITPR